MVTYRGQAIRTGRHTVEVELFPEELSARLRAICIVSKMLDRELERSVLRPV